MDRSRIPALSSCPRLRAQLAQESGLCPSAFSAEQPNVAIGVFVVNPADRVCEKNFLSLAARTTRDHSRAERIADFIPWCRSRKPPTASFSRRRAPFRE
jgi:hypothetical protein